MTALSEFHRSHLLRTSPHGGGGDRLLPRRAPQVIGSTLSAAAFARTLQQIALPADPRVQIGSETLDSVPPYMQKRADIVSELIQARTAACPAPHTAAPAHCLRVCFHSPPPGSARAQQELFAAGQEDSGPAAGLAPPSPQISQAFRRTGTYSVAGALANGTVLSRAETMTAFDAGYAMVRGRSADALSSSLSF